MNVLLRVYHLTYSGCLDAFARVGAERESLPLCHHWVRSNQQGRGNGPYVQEARHQRRSQGLQVTLVVLVVVVVIAVAVAVAVAVIIIIIIIFFSCYLRDG